MKKLKQFLEATILVAALPVVVYAELNRGASNTVNPVMAEQKTETIQDKPTATAENKSSKTISLFSLVTNIDL